MATTITAGNATSGAAIASDNTGTLQLKTGTGAGTTAISIDASQNVAIPGTLTVGGVPAGGGYIMRTYVSPSPWAKPAGLKAIKVTVVGAGGNGGPIGPANIAFRGGGGGGGGVAILYLDAPAVPASPITVTAGSGTSSFGPLVSATAGANAPSVTSPSPNIGPGGAAGTGSSGDINFVGRAGTAGGPGNSGTGGESALGFGFSGPSVEFSTPATGSNGNAALSPGYGAGGGGAMKNGPLTGAYTGGAGVPGIVIVEEFY